MEDLRSPYPLLDEVDRQFRPLLKGYETQIACTVNGFESKVSDTLYQLQACYIFFRYILDQSRELKECHPEIRVMAVRTANDLWAIRGCLQVGCAHQAAVLLRGVLESLITGRFIYQDLETRIRLFSDYQYIVLHKRIKRHKGTIEPNRAAQVSRAFRTVKRTYEHGKPWYHRLVQNIMDEDRARFGRNRFPSLHVLADICAMEEDYNDLYQLFSLAVHPSAGISAANEQLFDVDRTRRIAGMSISYTCQLFKVLLSRFDDYQSKSIVDYLAWFEFQGLQSNSD